MKFHIKIYLVLVGISVIILLCAGYLVSIELKSYVLERINYELDTQIEQFEYILSNSSNINFSYSHYQRLSELGNLRLTLISTDGTVIFDSKIDSSKISEVENHITRPEIMEASKIGRGQIIRKSKTLNQEFVYLAKKLDNVIKLEGIDKDIRYIRGSLSLAKMNNLITSIQTKFFYVSGIILFVIVFITYFISKLLIKPLHEILSAAEDVKDGDLERRITISTKDEFGKLSKAINAMVEKLKEDLLQMKKLERVRTEFLGDVSHELRTPIFTIQASLETLLNGAIYDECVNRDFLNKAMQSAKRLDALLSDLIEISRIESGDMRMNLNHFDINELITQTVNEMQPHCLQKNITLKKKFDSEFNQVYADKDKIKQVLINLIDNAIKYSPNESEIVVAAENVDNGVKVSVIDSGCGIPAEHIPHIFKRFYRVDKARSREVGGTGLGLAIVKHIIEAHGSKINVESQVGKGSNFYFILSK
ncbi:MAG: Phosphate regulon sensor protein PhoR (SphS) [Ignavibacteriae bacterium]|nr:MAG: Phosphate regulon sensor protein PhoR (SphS) [Ignavibacteriota bacterium]